MSQKGTRVTLNGTMDLSYIDKRVLSRSLRC